MLYHWQNQHAKKMLCDRGHDLNDPENQMPLGVEQGRRRCRECNRENGREQYRTIKKAARALGIGVVEYRTFFGRDQVVAKLIIAAVKADRPFTA